MLETLGTLVYEPWIYGLIVLSVLLDVFLPLLPSGILLVTAATAATAELATGPGAHLPEALVLLLCAATASVLGDFAAFSLARYGGRRFADAVARSHQLTSAQQRLGGVLARGGGPLVLLARFAPAGRSVMSFAAAAARRRTRDFLPWSATAGLLWATYSVGLGYFGGRLFGVTWGGTALSLAALTAAGLLAAHLLRRRPTASTS